MAKKIGFTLIILYIFVVIAIQFALATETVREVFTQIDRMEGISTAALIDNIGTIEIELSAQPLASTIDESRLRIFVNGQIAGEFESETFRLAVRNNSLIEIDATNSAIPFRITVSEISDNAMTISRNLEVVTDQNIAILGKIYVNEEILHLPWIF